MQKWTIGILVLAVLATLVLLFALDQHLSAIFLLLAIILFGLFGNPMKYVHEDMDDAKLLRRIGTKKRKKGRK